MDLMLSEAEMTRAEFHDHKWYFHPGNVRMGRAMHAAAHEARTFEHRHLPRLINNEGE